MSTEVQHAPAPFSLTEGGPFYRIVTRLHLVKPSGMTRAGWLALCAWLPLAIGAAVRVANGEPPGPLASDVSVSIRLLVALPLMLFAERLVEPQCRGAIAQMYGGGIADRSALDAIVARAEQLRDAWWAEAALLAVALLGGQLVLWGVVGSTGVFHGGMEAGTTWFPRIWYAVVALPFVQFVMFRWFWRWLIWSYVLAMLARLPLAALATHPDRAAGLGPLGWPVTGFGGFVLALGTIVSGAWATQLLAHHVTLKSLLPSFLVFVIIVTIVACGPLLLFSGHLFRARRRAIAEYTRLARDYVMRFDGKWIEHAADQEDLLGTSDIQSLNDLGGAFQRIEETRLFLLSPRKLVRLWLVALLPMLPLLASAITVEQIVMRLASTVLGGLPL